MVSGLPTFGGLPTALQAKPLAGPILPLTGTAATGRTGAAGLDPGSARPRRGREHSSTGSSAKASRREPKPGRLDDYRWPR